jgi:hypothetical protein
LFIIAAVLPEQCVAHGGAQDILVE